MVERYWHTLEHQEDAYLFTLISHVEDLLAVKVRVCDSTEIDGFCLLWRPSVILFSPEWITDFF